MRRFEDIIEQMVKVSLYHNTLTQCTKAIEQGEGSIDGVTHRPANALAVP